MRELKLGTVFTLMESGPVVLVTSHDGKEPSIMTLSWTMVLDFTPVFAITTGGWHHSYAALRKRRECVIATTTVDQLRHLLRRNTAPALICVNTPFAEGLGLRTRVPWILVNRPFIRSMPTGGSAMTQPADGSQWISAFLEWTDLDAGMTRLAVSGEPEGAFGADDGFVAVYLCGRTSGGPPAAATGA